MANFSLWKELDSFLIEDVNRDPLKILSTSPAIYCQALHSPKELVVFTILVSVLVFTIYLDTRLRTCTDLPENEESRAYKSIDTLPGPTPFPWKLIGNLFQLPMTRDIIPKCFEWCAKYGPCFKLTLFKENFVIVASAPLAQSILQSNELGHLTKTDVYHFLEGIDGLAFANGKWWRTMRKIASQAFHYQRSEKQIKFFNKHGDLFVEKLHQMNGKRPTNSDSTEDVCKSGAKKQSLELSIANCAVQIIIETFISKPGSCSYAESLEYVQSWKRFTEITAHRILHPWLGLDFLWKRHPQHDELAQVMGQIKKFAGTLINRYIEHQGHSEKNEEDDKNLISEMLRLNYSLSRIRSEVVAMLFAHETNSLGLYYLLYMLAAHPEHQCICRKEVDEIFNSRGDSGSISDEIYPDDLSNLKYLERCFLETIRLLPPVFIFGRKIETPLTLSNGVHLAAGANCLVLPIVIQRMSEYWDGNPLEFDPDRFLPEKSNKRHPYAYLPFSAGPRICLGMKSSIVNVKIIAAKILRRFEVTTTCKFEDIKFALNLTMAIEQDLDLQFVQRPSNASSIWL